MDSHLIVWKAFSLGKVKLFPSFTRYSCPRTTGNSVEGSAITYFATPTLRFMTSSSYYSSHTYHFSKSQFPVLQNYQLGEYVCIDSEHQSKMRK